MHRSTVLGSVYKSASWLAEQAQAG